MSHERFAVVADSRLLRVKFRSWIVRKTSKTCATGATRENETSDPSRFSRTPRKSHVCNETVLNLGDEQHSSSQLCGGCFLSKNSRQCSPVIAQQ